MLGTVIALIVLATIGYIAWQVSKQPNDFRYEKSTAMTAPPAAIHAVVNDLRQWNDWSPWAKVDPDAKSTLEGPPAGEGAKFSWDGNNKVGAGNMTIIESMPGSRVKMRLEFLRPMKAVNTAEFTFAAQNDNQTLVTWSMYGPATTMGKVMSVFMNCEKMMDRSFAEGLDSLKSIVEKK